MSSPSFRLICVPAALDEAPAQWASEMLVDGEIALLADGGGLEAINRVAHSLDLVSLPLVRAEVSAEAQAETVIDYARSLPLIWVAASFSEHVRRWAHDRGPMTLLVPADGPLPPGERRRIERFVAALGRQSE
jgi:hypothetical protein